MATKNQGAQIGVFHILKSIMDAKAKSSEGQAAAGRRAAAELPIMKEHITALRQVISNCRTFDPIERREAEEDLEDKELQLVGIQNRIVRGKHAEQDLKIVQQFNSNYNSACKIHNNASRIRELKELREELYERQYRLDDKIWACQLNMDLACRLPGLVNQAQEDANKYMTQYNELAARIQAINTEIEQLQR